MTMLSTDPDRDHICHLWVSVYNAGTVSIHINRSPSAIGDYRVYKCWFITYLIVSSIKFLENINVCLIGIVRINILSIVKHLISERVWLNASNATCSNGCCCISITLPVTLASPVLVTQFCTVWLLGVEVPSAQLVMIKATKSKSIFRTIINTSTLHKRLEN